MILKEKNPSYIKNKALKFSKKNRVSLDVGFYYMANAMGRLIGTVLSGWVFQAYGIEACLLISSVFVALAAMLSLGLPQQAITSPAENG